MSMNCLFKGILTTMLDSCLFNINSMTYNPQGLLSTASTVKNKKNPNQQKKKKTKKTTLLAVILSSDM